MRSIASQAASHPA
jgi:hypothetical protein